MSRPSQQLRADALAIWQASVDAVRSDTLVRQHLQVTGDQLDLAGEFIDLRRIRRIVVVGAGKAGTGMAAGVEQALGPELLAAKNVTGWINVPADCVRELDSIHVHAARPAGVNEPTSDGVAGTRKIMQLVESLQDSDLCICLISGGGSALLPAPAPGITLETKQQITRFLSGAGANIRELNTVRKQLSQVKGGGLALAATAGQLVTLIISDVLGDPLEFIASGPTVPDETTPADALEVLDRYAARKADLDESVWTFLERAEPNASKPSWPAGRIRNVVIGNLAVAVDAAGAAAERLGYDFVMQAATELEGTADSIGHQLASMASQMRREDGPECLITGGEPIVKLAPPDQRGSGGRNQQLVLAALDKCLREAGSGGRSALRGIVLLSGGTDGEDGPTDAAGAIADQELVDRMFAAGMSPDTYLRRNDAYNFFHPLHGLIHTGPTHTNVCDVRVLVVDRT